MGSIQFSVPGPPQGKARARTVRYGNGRISSYTPDKTVMYENLVKISYLERTQKIYNNKEALAVKIIACFEPPKSTSKKRKAQMLSGDIRPTKKPDIDNIVKCILDGLNSVAYRDDTQVVDVQATKKYAEKAEVQVEIAVIE